MTTTTMTLEILFADNRRKRVVVNGYPDLEWLIADLSVQPVWAKTEHGNPIQLRNRAIAAIEDVSTEG